jgi:3,2-trans-enoyl-CoA isomerase
VEKREGYVIVTLNNAPANILTVDIWHHLLQTLTTSEQDPDIHGFILTSHLPKPIFSAGNDISRLYAPATTYEGFREFWVVQTTFLARLYRSRLLTIAAITGHCPAGGCGMALCCDVRIMTDRMTSANHVGIGLNEVALGISVPRYWALLMVRTMGGQGRAEKYLGWGRMMAPEKALELGLVDRVVPRDQVLIAAIGMMEKSLMVASEGRVLTKRILREQFSLEWEAYGEEEAREAWIMLSQPKVVETLGMVLKSLGRGKL